MEEWMIALIIIGAVLVVSLILLFYIFYKIAKKKAIKRNLEEKKLAEENKAKAELEAKITAEENAAAAFTERRSVDKSLIEQNRRVAGASAVTKKDNIVK